MGVPHAHKRHTNARLLVEATQKRAKHEYVNSPLKVSAVAACTFQPGQVFGLCVHFPKQNLRHRLHLSDVSSHAAKLRSMCRDCGQLVHNSCYCHEDVLQQSPGFRIAYHDAEHCLSQPRHAAHKTGELPVRHLYKAGATIFGSCVCNDALQSCTAPVWAGTTHRVIKLTVH